ncbi:Ethylene-responsive transcription factor CRF1 [Hordeum vulgare]|nr:Ethylene-responsive transcription factor CRF1 [Hordeum vulgare]
MNFPEVRKREEARARAPPSRLITMEERRIQQRRERRILIVEMDEQAMTTWREHFPQDVIDEHAFWVQRRADRLAERNEKHRHKALVIFQSENLDTL